jgi:hypothetical protein
MAQRVLSMALLTVLAATGTARELTSAYVVPAAANAKGSGGTSWHTDLTLSNPHGYNLPVTLVLLPSNRDNSAAVPMVDIELFPYESLNLWNVLGPDGFDAVETTGALLVYADDLAIDCSASTTACDFAVFSRTYTLDPAGRGGEFGQAIPGFPANLGLDRTVLAYLPQLLEDSDSRTNVGAASWTDEWVQVRLELQDAAGQIIDRHDTWIPPYGHAQWRLPRGVQGGTAVMFIVGGPSDAALYPYASVVNRATGDPAYVEAHLSPVGLTAQAAGARVGAGVGAGVGARALPGRIEVPTFSVERLRSGVR